ncbi:AAA family ATPase [Pseudomonas syringae]|uniref:AAA family ATPase n=1 Tax=Pseudomonas syringae TaxID=317 RepID=UPI0003526730|nr:AAA family ATPase [Pseudomonas syringae]EPF68304.1 Prophage PssSM-03, Orf59 [Pseudomonas syringae pv. syringae SM]
MIIGLLLRNYKCYNGINYIPIAKNYPFSAYIGENGAGKSSILEALDLFFNGGVWNINNEALSGGLSTRTPFICPIFLLEKKKWATYAKTAKEKEVLACISEISDVLWKVGAEAFNAAQREDAASFIAHRDSLTSTVSKDQYFLCVIGQEHDSTEKKYISIFSSLVDIPGIAIKHFPTNAKPPSPPDIEKERSMAKCMGEIAKFIVSQYNYIYTPAEVDVEKYTKIESKSVQKLSGKNIETILRGVIGDETLKIINKKLSTFIGEIESTLKTYQYKRPQKRQSNLNFSDISAKVIETYFSIRVLNKFDGQNRTPVSQLSSGEKKKALVDIAHAFLLKDRDVAREIVFAMDEPEASLHTGAIFEQFEKLANLSEMGIQCILTTHWYGFVPTLSRGTAINVYKYKDKIATSLIDLSFYRETIRKQKEASKGLLPSDIGLKSTNDLVQTIMSSLRKKLPYSWIICEGSSERQYFESYFSQEIAEERLKILPVGGAKEVKKLFDYLELPIKEDSKEIRGKVFCLIDTDEQQIECNCADYPNLKLRRLLDVEGAIQLVKGSDNRKTPPTEIEDSLNAEVFIEALLALSAENSEIAELISKIGTPDFKLCARSAFDWRASEYKKLKKIFDEGTLKFDFASIYVEQRERVDLEEIPAWIEEIRRDYIDAIPAMTAK